MHPCGRTRLCVCQGASYCMPGSTILCAREHLCGASSEGIRSPVSTTGARSGLISDSNTARVTAARLATVGRESKGRLNQGSAPPLPAVCLLPLLLALALLLAAAGGAGPGPAAAACGVGGGGGGWVGALASSRHSMSSTRCMMCGAYLHAASMRPSDSWLLPNMASALSNPTASIHAKARSSAR